MTLQKNVGRTRFPSPHPQLDLTKRYIEKLISQDIIEEISSELTSAQQSPCWVMPKPGRDKKSTNLNDKRFISNLVAQNHLLKKILYSNSITSLRRISAKAKFLRSWTFRKRFTTYLLPRRTAGFLNSQFWGGVSATSVSRKASKNGPAIFQAAMQDVFNDLDVLIYLDDLLTADETLQDHYRSL